MSAQRISVVGMGKLGACLAAVLADAGHSVVGVDVDADKVATIRAGHSPLHHEPGLGELIERNHSRLTATTDYSEATAASDTTFIVTATPSDERGAFRLDDVLSACRQVGECLQSKATGHDVVIVSTVLPGAVDGPIRSTLEEASGRAVGGPTLGLSYNPEFIALGSIIRDLRHPDFLLIGETDPAAGHRLEQLLTSLYHSPPHVARMSAVNAELTKLSVNTFVTMKVTFANMIAGVCDRLPGADVDVVTQALGMDTRIGSRYLRAALGYGGPCFPRDNVALTYVADSVGARSDLAAATDALNRHQVSRLMAKVESAAPAEATVGILGLTYKPHTDVTTESQGLQLLEGLVAAGRTVSAYDPAAGPALAHRLTDGVIRATAADVIARSDVVVVATPWPEFSLLRAEDFARKPESPRLVLDCWRIFGERLAVPGVRVLHLGEGPDLADHLRAAAEPERREKTRIAS